jgi:hypothetical protein
MSSFQYHYRIALDPERPFNHRMSHARSCALVLSRRWGVGRSEVLEHVRAASGVNLFLPATEEQLGKALQVLEALSRRSSSPPQGDGLVG